MATKILRVFQEFTSEGYVPMPPTGNIDYGYTIAGTFPSTTPATFQTDNPDLEVTVTEVTDFYVWIRSHGTEWNYQYTRNVRVYPDSPSINNVVMGIIIANLGNTVPYTGATKNVDLGEFGIKAGHVGFDLTPTGTPTDVGTMVWNDQDGTLDLKLKGGNVTLQIGQEQLTRIVNKTGGDLLESNYQAVRISGAQGNRLKVALAQANNDANSAETLGIITETILNNQEGFITTSGLVRNINTTGSIQGETWVDGDMLYLSGTTAGRLTNIKPQAPTHTVIMGYVVRAHATQGQIYVKVDNGYELDELHNVKITSVAENDFLIYDATNSVWENRAILKTNGYIPYFDSTDLFKQSPLFTDGTNVTMNGMPLLLSDSGTLNYITKFGSTKTVINSLLYDTGTKVGIGTTNPEYLFTVVGGAMGVYSSSTNYGFIDTANTSMRLVSANGFNFTANNIGTIANTRVDANGNWGFGIGTPAYKVDVNGDVNTNGIYRINGSPLSTSNIAEGTNLYFTSNRVLGQVLTGLNTSLTGVVTAVDSLIVGISKLQNQVSSIVSGVSSVFGRTGAVTAQSGDYTTTLVTEGTNLYYTDARARNAISGGIGISYNNTTGLIAFSGTLYTDSSIRALFSAGSGISYNNTTGVIASTITQYTDAMARASLSFVAGSGAYNSTTGVITIPTNTNQLTNGANYITLASLSASSPLSYNSGTGAFSISQASGTTNGFLSSTDWTTFNNKQNALGYTPVPTTRTITINGTSYDLSADRSWTIATGIGGTGTTNYLPKFTGSTTLWNSLIYDNGSQISIGTTGNVAGLDVRVANNNISAYFLNSGADFKIVNATGITSIGTSVANPLVFLISDAERMRITSTGNVGIGTSSPSVKLFIKDASTLNPSLFVLEGLNGGRGLEIKLGTDGLGANGSAVIYNTRVSAPYGEHIWQQAGTQRMRLDTSGNLGLGVTPSAWGAGTYGFDIGPGSAFYNPGSGNQTQILNNSYHNGTNFIYKNNAQAARYRMLGDSHEWHIAPSGTAGTAISFTQAMTLDASGRLGVGLTNPSTRLDIQETASNTYGTINIRGNNRGGGIDMYSNTTWLAQMYADTSSNVVFATGSGFTERLRINGSTGNVSIGNTNNTYKLDVSGTTMFRGDMRTSSGNLSLYANSVVQEFYDSANSNYLYILQNYSSQFRIYNANTATTILNFASTGAATFSSSVILGTNGNLRLSADATDGQIVAAFGKGLKFYTNDGNSNPLNLTSGGNVGIGTNNPGGTLHVAGGGSVIFGSTPNFNYKFNVQGFSGKYISFWTPTIQSVYNNGLISHDGNGLTGLTPMGYNATIHVFNGEVTGGGTMQVNGDVNISGAFKINGTAIGTGGGGVSGSGTTNIHAKWSGSTSLTNAIVEDDGSANVYINGASVANASALNFRIGGSNKGLIAFVGNDMSISNLSSSPIRFLTNNSEKMRLTNNGKLLINQTSEIAGNALLQITQGFSLDPAVAIKSANYIMRFTNLSDAQVGSIQHNETNTTYGTSSDYRLKTDLRNFNGLQLLDKINVYDFAWKSNNSRMFGVIAHELQEVLPYAVSGIKDGKLIQNVDYSLIVPILVKSIKELKAEIATLKDNV